LVRHDDESLIGEIRIGANFFEVLFKNLTQSQIGNGRIFEILNACPFRFDCRYFFQEPRIYFLQMISPRSLTMVSMPFGLTTV
jgi:hypothetical protein